MKLLIKFLLSVIAIAVVAHILPGVHVSGGWKTYLILAVVLGIINIFVKPVLKLLTLPLNIITLGLFGIILNALLILLATHIVSGFSLDGFLTALYFGIILSLVHGILHLLEK